LHWGDGAGALELMRRTWGNMLTRSANTSFWEWVGPDGDAEFPGASLAHAWSAGITPLLGTDMVGFTVEDDGTRVLRPANVLLPRYRTRIPGTPVVAADVTYTPAYQRLEVTEGGSLIVEVSDQPGQRLWLDGAALEETDPRVKVGASVLRVGPLNAPFKLDFVPRTPL
jgi:hypothetical protein